MCKPFVTAAHAQGFLNKKAGVTTGLSFAFKDEHQGEGGTLVFVKVDITIRTFSWQEENR